MSKEVKVQLTVSYDKIRQVLCLMYGKVLQDSELEELIGTEVLNIESNIFGEQKDEIEQVVSAMVLAKKLQEKEDLEPKKKSKFQERLEAMQQQRSNGNERL
jgi:hypothetical protein